MWGHYTQPILRQSLLLQKLLGLPDDRVRNEGIHIVSGRGGGKSRLLGRYIAPLDFIRGVPTVVFDNGDTIDNFLDKLASLSPRLQDELWPHVRYVNMAGQDGRICPFPIFYRFGSETDYEVAERFVNTIGRMEPELKAARVQGFPPLARLARAAGRILLAIGGSITEMTDLITKPDRFRGQIAEAVAKDPYLQSAVYDLGAVKHTDTLLNSLSIFHADKTVAAIFGGQTPGINWQEVLDQRQIVLLDLRDVRVPELRRFAVNWVFWGLIAFLEYRGATLTEPLSLIFDEFAVLTKAATMEGQKVFADDLDNLLNNLMRHHNLWLTLAHQALGQFDRTIQQMLLDMGTQYVGAVSDMDEATHLSRQLFRIDPYKIKRYENVWGSESIPFMGSRPMVLEQRPVEYTIPEQHYQGAYAIRSLQPFHFYVKHPRSVDAELLSIKALEENIWPRKLLVKAIRAMLMERDGMLIEEVLHPMQGGEQSGRIKGDGTRPDRPSHLSTRPELAKPTSPDPQEEDDEAIFSYKG